MKMNSWLNAFLPQILTGKDEEARDWGEVSWTSVHKSCVVSCWVGRSGWGPWSLKTRLNFMPCINSVRDFVENFLATVMCYRACRSGSENIFLKGVSGILVSYIALWYRHFNFVVSSEWNVTKHLNFSVVEWCSQ